MREVETERADGYVGIDRRHRRDATGGTPLSGVGLSSAALGAGFLLALLLIRTTPGREQDRTVIAIVLATGAAAVACAGAVLCLARFRMVAERTALSSGTILLLVGVGWLVPARIGPMLRDDWRTEVGGFALGSALMIGALVLSVAFLSHVNSSLTIRSHVVWASIGVGLFGSVLALGAPRAIGVDGLEGPALGQVLAGPILGLSAAVLLVLAYLRQRTLLAYLGLCLFGLEAAELLAIRATSIADPAWLASCLVSLVAVAVSMRGVVAEYLEGHEALQARLYESWAEKELTSRQLARQQEQQEERFHDLRSGLLGVEAVALSGALRSAAAKGLLSQELARLRDLTQAGSGPAERFDVVELLQTFVELRLRQGEAVTIDGPSKAIVRASPNDFAEIVSNLLDNAARHAPRTPVMIVVRQLDHHITISVRDRGPGIPPALVPRVLDRGTTSHPDGSGLGLYISDQLARRMGGQLSADNRVGGGAEFTLSIPISDVDKPANAPEQRRAPRDLDAGTGSGWTRRRSPA